ncbi:MAG: hypothetical protein Q9M44_00695, partial [Ghiorsea sp.]|nr:hypothetical protein [Ghiorsea sp.]
MSESQNNITPPSATDVSHTVNPSDTASALQIANLSQIGLAYDLAKRAKKSARLHVWICPDVRS